MTARKARSGGWTTKTYRNRWWKVFHPFKYFKAEARKAHRGMSPLKALGRVMSVPEIKAGLRTTTTKVNAGTRQAEVQRATKKAAAAKKTMAKRPDPYQVAAGIPQRNRNAAANMAKATQPRKTVAVRKKDGSGRFDGRKAMDPREREMFEQAEQRRVDPVLLPRTPRRRSQP